MDHVVYVDASAHEVERLIDGTKSMIVRGATGRKLPYGRVNPNDTLYFIRNNGEKKVVARASVTSVFNSEKLSIEDSATLIDSYKTKLRLSEKQYQKWAGKRYLVLIGIEHTREVMPFEINRSSFSNMDDWLPVQEISLVKC